MLKLIIILALFVSHRVDAFTLISKNYRLKKPDKTVLKFSSEGCPGNSANVKKAMKEAVEIWNKASESRLKMKVGGTSGTSLAGVAPAGEVILGCGTLSGSLGETEPNESNGSAKITLNDASYNSPGAATYGSLLGTVTHELGHAVGLGHSKDRASVMTYESNGWSAGGPNYLSHDDEDGVIYLYPNEKEVAGLMGSCSSIASDGKDRKEFGADFLLGFLGLVGISFVINKLKVFLVTK